MTVASSCSPASSPVPPPLLLLPLLMRYLSYSLSTATLLCIQSTSRRSPRETKTAKVQTNNKSRTDAHSHKAQSSANKIQTYNRKHNNSSNIIIIIIIIKNISNSSNSDNNGYESIKQTAAECTNLLLQDCYHDILLPFFA
jgi:LAS superfamily LD-carboxypeptidase LdcB